MNYCSNVLLIVTHVVLCSLHPIYCVLFHFCVCFKIFFFFFLFRYRLCPALFRQSGGELNAFIR